MMSPELMVTISKQNNILHSWSNVKSILLDYEGIVH